MIFGISFIKLTLTGGILKSTLKRGRYRPDLHAGSAGELSENHLHVIEGFADYEKYHNVRDQEGTAAVFVSCIREPPDISEADRECHAGHKKFQLVSPLRPCLLLLLDRHRDLRRKLPRVSKESYHKGDSNERIASC